MGNYIYVSTTGKGILKITKDGKIIDIHSSEEIFGKNSPAQITKILPGRADSLWIASLNSGVSLYDVKNRTAIRHDLINKINKALVSQNVYDIFRDESENIWFGSNDGLVVYVSGSNQVFHYGTGNSSIPADRITSIYQTSDDTYWIGTFFGMSKARKTSIKSVTPENSSLSNSSVNAFAFTDDGAVWVGTDDGLNKRNNAGTDFTWFNTYTKTKISDDVVMSLFSDEDSLWIGTFSGGANKLNLTTLEVETFQSDPSDPTTIGSNGITSFLRTDADQLIVGTYEGGLSIYNEESKSFTRHNSRSDSPSPISNDNVLALFQDSLGFIWVGTENGLNLFKPSEGTFRTFYYKRGVEDTLSSNMVWSFHEDKQGDLWIGTNGGGLSVWQFEDRKILKPSFKHLSEDKSLPSSSIFGIEGGADGEIWLSHNKGITRITRDGENVRHFRKIDGLQDTEFNMGASAKSPNGKDLFWWAFRL